MRILVCGGAGFIGWNFIRFVLAAHPDDVVVNYDALTYAANVDHLAEAAQFGSRYAFIRGDITEEQGVRAAIRTHAIDAVINFAAETHVDRSIHVGARAFVQTNVLGVHTLLDVVRALAIPRFLQVSTDEVYGALDLASTERFTEATPYAPNSPYAAAKAGGDLLCRSYVVTHRVPVIVTRCANNYGPYQFPEKLIPFTIFRALADAPVPIYGDGRYVRDWIHVDDHVAALDLLLRHGTPGEVYNISADNERNNLEIVRMVLRFLGKSEHLITHVADRPGHDRRYASDAAKLRAEFGWRPTYGSARCAEGMERTVQWYLDHRSWVERLRAYTADINAHLATSAPAGAVAR